MEKLLLAIDTATRVASLALHDGGRVRAELTWEAPDYHTAELLPNIVHILAQLRADASDLAGLAVVIGPGSFTGVRVGVAAAKGVCLAGGLPIYGVPTFDVMAQAHRPLQRGQPLVALIQIGRGRLCAARYIWRQVGWQLQGEPWLTTLAALGEDWDGPTLVCGELDAAGRNDLQLRLGNRVCLAPPAASLRRAGYLAEIGWQRLRLGQADDLERLTPIYVQTPGSPQANV